MAIPTKERTWSFRVNQVIPAGTTAEIAGAVLWNVKEMLLASGATVVGSCNSVAFGMDGVDRWTTPPVTTVTGRYAWIVLAMSGVQVLLAYRFSTASGGSISAFHAGTSTIGLTGGNLTSVPDASDLLCTYGAPTSAASVGVFLPSVTHTTALVFHGMCDPSEGVVRWFIANSGAFACFNFLDRIADPVASKVNARTAFAFSGNQLAALGSGGATFNNNFSSWVDNSRVPNMFGLLAYRTGTNPVTSVNAGLGLGVNQLLNEWPMYPLAILSEMNGYRGVWGRMKDLFSTPEDPTLVAGVTLPADNSRQWVFSGGDFALPWNGSIPLVA